jgi:ubiquinone/menaquinone biosynthesis C-methylase UbiE
MPDLRAILKTNPKAFYENNADYLARIESQGGNPEWFRHFYTAILEHSRPDDALLDCGCGGGITTAHLHRFRPRIQGVDFSQSFIERARTRGDFFSVMDLTDLKFPAAHFDLVCSADVIEHIPQLEKALSEMARVLKPGGIMVLQAPNLSTNLLSTNYHRTVSNMLRKVRHLARDLVSPRLRTIEKFPLDVLAGDDDAFNLISPLWLKGALRKMGFRIRGMTTYALYFVPSSRVVRVAFGVLSRLPVTRHVGGRIVLVAQKD